MNLNALFRWNSWLIPPLGIFLNFILLWAICCRTPKEMWVHCQGLIINCILAIPLFSIGFVGIPVWTIANFDASGIVLIDGYLVPVFRNFFVQNPMQIWNFFLCWHFFYFANLLTISVHFVCRYFTLNRGMLMKIPHYALFLVIILVISYATCRNGNSMVLKALPKNATKLAALWIDFEQNPIYGVFSLDPVELLFESGRYRDHSDIVHTDDSILGLWTWICDNILLIFCGRRIVRFVKEEAMNELHKQLNNTLIYLALCQLLFQSMFVLLYVISLIIPLDNFALLWSASIVWLPLLNPLVSLFTFPPYRAALTGPVISRIFEARPRRLPFPS